MRKILFFVLIVHFASCNDKLDGTTQSVDYLMGNYLCKSESWKCTDDSLRYVGPHIVFNTIDTLKVYEKNDTVYISQKNSILFQDKKSLFTKEPVIDLWPFSSSFQRALFYLSRDSISLAYGRKIGECHGSDYWTYVKGRKI